MTVQKELPEVETRQTGQDWRARLRGSRSGNLMVLLVTFALVLGGAFVLNQKGDDDAATAAAGANVSAVELKGGSSAPPPEVGAAAADFAATTIDGKKVSLSQFRGRPVWLTFGASWCSSCRSEAVDVQSAYAEAQPNGAMVLGVYISEDRPTVRQYAQRVGATYPQVADPETKIASTYRVVGIPAHYFIDANGTIRSIQVGALSRKQIDASLAALAS